MMICPNCGHEISDELVRDAALALEPDRYVQARNPMSKRWVKIDRWSGRIVGTSPEPWPSVPVKGSASSKK